MEVQQVLHMKGGEGETSYANNSLPQRSVVCKTKPFLEEAIEHFYSKTKPKPKTMTIADLGCSMGPNALLPTTMILDAVHDVCSRSAGGRRSPEFHVFLNDLPGNDFNSLFQALPSFYEKLRAEKGDDFGPCFVCGTPGSFYRRLFPSESLHFVYSANSLHWLSQVPPELAGNKGGLINKGNIALGRTSPYSVFEAYIEQFRRDFTIFLKLRSLEIVSGGCMVLSLMGRRIADPFSQECHHYWDDLAHALRDMVSEGTVEEAKMDSFSMPYYEPHVAELQNVIEKEGSFDIIQLKELYRASNVDRYESSNIVSHNVLANCVRAVTEPMLASHFGATMIGELFKRFDGKLTQRGDRKNVFLVVSLTRKG